MKFIRLIPVFLYLLIAALAGANSENFSLSDLQGKEHKLSDYKGKWIVINYWATWCPPCVKEIPELVSFHEKHAKNDAVVLGVNFEDISEQKVIKFLEDYKVNYPILLSEPETYSDLGVITGLPTTFIVSPDGEVVHKKVGSVDRVKLEKLIEYFKLKLK